MTTAVEPLRFKHFRALWSANVFSASGSIVQTVAASWLMFELTGSSTWVGFMVASPTLPLVLFALAAGALADMFDRARLMLVAQGLMCSSAAAMAVVTLLDIVTPGLLLALGLLLGSGLALNVPAWQALLPELVPRGMIASALALHSGAINGVKAIVPAIAGFVVVTYGPAAGFAINAGSYLLVIGVLLVVGPQLEERFSDGSQSMSSAMALGVRFARFTPAFRNLLSLVAIFAFTSAVVQATLPVHTDALGGDAVDYGLLLGGMGAGALVAAFMRSLIEARMKGSIVGRTIALFGLSSFALGIAPSLVVAFIAMSLCGFFWLLTLTTLNASAQLMAPGWIRGRAMSLYRLAFAGVVPLGAISSGILADLLGTGVSIVSFSFGVVLLGVASPRFRLPKLDDIDMPEFTIQKSEAGPPGDLKGGPVVVMNTWILADPSISSFLKIMSEVRRIRLSTGAYRWRLLRHASDPLIFSELFVIDSWDEYRAQHARIDDASVALIKKAEGYDLAARPRSVHMIAIDDFVADEEAQSVEPGN